MSDPLAALFSTHLPTFTAGQLKDYLLSNGIVSDWKDWPQVRWVDPDEGKAWDLFDRVVDLALTSPPTPTLPGLLAAMAQELVPTDSRKWHQADEPTRRARARAYLATQILATRPEDGGAGSALAAISPWFATSFARKPAGTPAAGFARPGDGGWLGYVIDEFGRTIARAPHQAPLLADVAAGWLGANVVGGYGLYRWWGVGGVSGTRKRRTFVGEPGWETPGSLPGTPRLLSAFSAPVRPAQLFHHFEHVACVVLAALTRAMVASQVLEPRATLNLDGMEHAADLPAAAAILGPALTERMRLALYQLAHAGLVGTPTQQPRHRFDGRALQALSLLVLQDPGGSWASEQEKHALAQAVVDHQRAWQDDPRPHVQALATCTFAPSQSPAWDWATALVAPAPPRPPRP